MLKSLFGKLLIIFIAVIIFSFSVAGATLYLFLDYNGSNKKIHELERCGNAVNNIVNNLQNQNSDIAGIMLQQAIDSFGDSTGSFSWVINKNAQIVTTSGTMDSLQNKFDNNIMPDERQYKKVLSGKAVIERRGDFYGLFKESSYSWLTVETPLIDKAHNNQVIGAVYFSTPLVQVTKYRNQVISYFLISVGVSVLITIIIVYFFSRRISKPLKEMNSAVKVIAKGDFGKRINISSKDEIGQLAQGFNQMVGALENLESMRRGFIANVSHELRTPMTSIRGFIEGILDGTIPPDKQNNYLVIVRDEINRLNRLVNDVLTLARLESGEVKLNLKEFNINELLRRSVIKLESLLTEKELQVEADFEEEDMFVRADPDAIERVVINLIHNAIKFTGHNGKINISTYKKKDKVYVSIRDNGTGIDKSEIDMIWERFYKSDKSRGMDKGGTGLGLSIVRNIILEHKQDINVESEAGKGAKFTFTLENSRVSGV